MKHNKLWAAVGVVVLVVVFSALFFVFRPFGHSIPPGYNTPIPKTILTPPKVKTSIGELEFFDGFPNKKTVATIYHNLDRMRGVEAFLNGIPAASLQAMYLGAQSMGVKDYHQVLITKNLLDSNPLFLTGNTDTVYAMAFLNLEKDGPMVIEVPANMGPGTVDDAFFRFVVDMGLTGPDQGKGGKYLIVHESDNTPLPEKGYVIAKSPSHLNLLILRGFLVDGKPDASVRRITEGLKIYPLKQKDDPEKMSFINGSKAKMNTIQANDFQFYNVLNQVIQREPVGFISPHLRGIFAGIGIEKGSAFNPDARMKKILTDAAAIGNATARSLAFANRNKQAYLYSDSQWQTLFGSDYRWLKDDGKGGRNLDARTAYFYVATVNTPSMIKKQVGKGSQYAIAYKDNKGQYLDGGKDYQLRLPANPPAKNFWSVVIYDPQSRSELQTSQPFPSKNNLRDKLITNKDGSVTLYFGPKPPPGKKANWVQTIPGKGWFPILRLYGPLKPWFNKAWRPGELELIPQKEVKDKTNPGKRPTENNRITDSH